MRQGWWGIEVAEEAVRLNEPEDWETLSEGTKAILAAWIVKAIKPAKTVMPFRSSYSIKHDFEREMGIYVTNGQFKGAMLAAGFPPVNPNELNWRFRIRPTYRPKRPKHYRGPAWDPCVMGGRGTFRTPLDFRRPLMELDL